MGTMGPILSSLKWGLGVGRWLEESLDETRNKKK